MTNEKAIEVLTEINYESIREDVVQATNMAIKSLSEQYKFEQRKKQVERLGQIYMNFITELENNYNSEKNNYKLDDSGIKVDLISREDVLNIIYDEEWEYIDYVIEDIGGNVDTHIRCYTENIRDRLLRLSTYPEERPTAKLIRINSLYKCSNCGELICCEANFCPDCGAKIE